MSRTGSEPSNISAEQSMSCEAAAKVFTERKLISLIMSSLDELPIVRIQRVNRVIFDVLHKSTPLLNRIGTVRGFRPVLDTTKKAAPAQNVHSGIIHDCSSWITLTLLPHALHAARSDKSSLQWIHIATEPVNRVVFHYVSRYSLTGEPLTIVSQICNPNGVTIGQFLRVWAERTSPNNLGFPIRLTIPWGEPRMSMCGGQFTWFDTELGSMRHILNWMNNVLTDAEYADAVEKAQLQMVTRWWYTTMSIGDSSEEPRKWFKSSMAEQSDFVLAVLKWQRLIMSMPGWDGRFSVPRLPALAVRRSLGAGGTQAGPRQRMVIAEQTFELEYAAGIVFNRIDIGAADNIWL